MPIIKNFSNVLCTTHIPILKFDGYPDKYSTKTKKTVKDVESEVKLHRGSFSSYFHCRQMNGVKNVITEADEKMA